MKPLPGCAITFCNFPGGKPPGSHLTSPSLFPIIHPRSRAWGAASLSPPSAQPGTFQPFNPTLDRLATNRTTSSLQSGRRIPMEENRKLKVYLETSFVSYLTGGPTLDAKVAADQAFTRLWWKSERDKADVFVSGYTIAECEAGDQGKSKDRLEAIKGVTPLSGDVERETALARKLIAGHALPEGETTDALHIAAAAVHGMDVMLTWNCRHLANPHTLPKTREIIRNEGLFCPEIMTPKTFLETHLES